MAFTFIVPELTTYFTEQFPQMLINHIYNNWTTSTGELAKPVAMQGQNNLIEFRTGLPSEFKSLQVLTTQGQTRVEQHLQAGQKRDLMTTQIYLTLKAVTMPMNISTYLGTMEQEIINICGRYKQASQTGNMSGIKDLIYDGGDRDYKASDTFDKSDWRSIHSIRLLYELVDVQ